MSPELIFLSVNSTELQKAKEEEKEMNTVKMSFERQLQNERTLKIQVCVWAPTQVWKAWDIFYTFILLLLFSQTTVMSHHLLLRIMFSCRLVLNSGQNH